MADGRSGRRPVLWVIFLPLLEKSQGEVTMMQHPLSMAFESLRDGELRAPSGLSLGKTCEKYMREQQTNLLGHNGTYAHADKSSSLFYLWFGTNNDYDAFPKATNYSVQLCHRMLCGRQGGICVSHPPASDKFGLSKTHHGRPPTPSRWLLEEVKGMNSADCTSEWPRSPIGIQTWCLVWHAVELEGHKAAQVSLISQAGELKSRKSQVNFPAGLKNHSVNWMPSQSWKVKVAIGELFQVFLQILAGQWYFFF